MSSIQLVLHQHDFAVEDFCRLKPAIAFPAHSLFADCRFNVHLEPTFRVKEEFSGPGIYAVCYDKQLIYIGKYLGQKKNAFAGNIARLRWVQHLGSMTMRDRRVSLSKRSLDLLLDPSFSHRDNPLIRSLAHAFDHDSASGSTTPFLQRDRGCLSTVNRVLFALEHWPLFSQADGPALGGFSFHYFRVEKPSSELPTEGLRNLISVLEDRLVETFRPQCNAVIPQGTAPSWKWPKVLDDLGNEIKRFFSSDVDPKYDANSRCKIGKPIQMYLSDEVTPEPEETSAEVRFFERLEGAPSEAVAFIDELRSWAYEKDDVELHFTNTKGGDLRLRKHGLGKGRQGSQNFLTLVWQTRDQKFRIDNICQPSVKHLNATLSPLVYPLSNAPLKSTMKIDAQTVLAEKKSLIMWIESARAAFPMQD